jgi:predicted dehydrogenase
MSGTGAIGRTAPVRYGIVGAGARAEYYVRAMLDGFRDAVTLVAVGDPNPGRRELLASRAESTGGSAVLRFEPQELERVVRDAALDRVIIASPDHTHAAYIDRVVRAGADAVVEKPLTTDAAGCRTVAAAVADTGREVVAAFNYRYSPRNGALRELLMSGAIGEVTSVHFEWLLDTFHGADYFRRWHRDKAMSGGLLVHKASHHFDLVNWWLDDRPARVFASGGLRFYGAENAERRGLGPRPERGSAGPASDDPFVLDMRQVAGLKQLYLDNEGFDGYLRDRDVFDPGITIEDNLSVVVDYERGASMSYSLNAHSPWEGYSVAVNGTRGRAELQVVERSAVLRAANGAPIIDPSAQEDRGSSPVRPAGERLLLQRHWENPVEVSIPDGAGAHGGGDALMFDHLFHGDAPDPLRRRAGWRDGVAAVAVGIAGNRSLETGQAVRVADLELDS